VFLAALNTFVRRRVCWNRHPLVLRHCWSATGAGIRWSPGQRRLWALAAGGGALTGPC